jgi:hypothetical protein
MKKLAIFTMAILVSLALVLPSLATEFQFDGSMRVRGFYKSNANSTLAEESASDAYYDFRFRPELIFKVNDTISVYSRVAVFNEKFGTKATTPDARNISEGKSDVAEWDRGWIIINTDQFGKFQIGRMTGGLFGLDVFDNELTADRIKWTSKINENLTLLALTEKYTEDANSTLSDYDQNGYAVAGIYKTDNIEAGLLILRKTTETDAYSESVDYLDPYFKGQFGIIGVNAEIKYATGSREMKAGGDFDASGLGYYLAVNAAFGPATVELGYASAGGDDTTTTEDEGLIKSFGTEWTPLVVLQDANALIDSANTANSCGANLIYLQADYKLSEDMTLTGIIAKANAN